MVMQNLAASRFVIERFLDELEAYDRDIPVASGLSVGDVADALIAFLSHREIERLSRPEPQRRPARRRRAMPGRPMQGRRRRSAAICALP